MKRLDEIYVEELLEHGCQIIRGRLSVTPVKRYSAGPTEYMVDCDHSKHHCSQLQKTKESAAKLFCMLKNVIYTETNEKY